MIIPCNSTILTGPKGSLVWGPGAPCRCPDQSTSLDWSVAVKYIVWERTIHLFFTLFLKTGFVLSLWCPRQKPYWFEFGYKNCISWRMRTFWTSFIQWPQHNLNLTSALETALHKKVFLVCAVLVKSHEVGPSGTLHSGRDISFSLGSSKKISVLDWMWIPL